MEIQMTHKDDGNRNTQNALIDTLFVHNERAAKRLLEEFDKLNVGVSLLRRLVEKLDKIDRDPNYMSVWVLAEVHGQPYTGPDCREEREDARKFLNELDGARCE
jgi:hypothetical protein